MNIILNGSNGRMGRIVAEAVEQGGAHAVVAKVDWSYAAGDGYSELKQYEGPADVVIDFSSHAATQAVTEYCVSRGLPVVIATTGQTDAELDMIRAAAKAVPVFLSGNMSIGVAVLADLALRQGPQRLQHPHCADLPQPARPAKRHGHLHPLRAHLQREEDSGGERIRGSRE